MTCLNPCCRDHARVMFCPACWLMVVLAKIAEVAIIWAIARLLR